MSTPATPRTPKPRPAPPGGASHVAHTLTPNDANTLTLSVAQHLYAAGHTMASLAARYGVCETVIYNRLTEAGTPLRRKSDFKQVDAGLLAALAARIGIGALP